MVFQALQIKKKVELISVYVERNTINSTNYTRVPRHKTVIRNISHGAFIAQKHVSVLNWNFCLSHIISVYFNCE
jgi:hypothetical protein